MSRPRYLCALCDRPATYPNARGHRVGRKDHDLCRRHNQSLRDAVRAMQIRSVGG